MNFFLSLWYYLFFRVRLDFDFMSKSDQKPMGWFCGVLVAGIKLFIYFTSLFCILGIQLPQSWSSGKRSGLEKKKQNQSFSEIGNGGNVMQGPALQLTSARKRDECMVLRHAPVDERFQRSGETIGNGLKMIIWHGYFPSLCCVTSAAWLCDTVTSHYLSLIHIWRCRRWP